MDKITDLLKAIGEHIGPASFAVGCTLVFLGFFDVADFKSLNLRTIPAWYPIVAGSALLAVGVFPSLVAMVKGFSPGIGGTRLKALTGDWDGSFEQPNLRGVLQVKLILRGGSVEGSAKLSFELDNRARVLQLKLKGGALFHDRFLKLDYAQDQAGVVQFGALVVELLPDADELHGNYAGFGSLTNKIAGGSVKLRRVEKS